MRRSSATSRWHVMFATSSRLLLSLAAIVALNILTPQAAQAAIVFSGNYDPGSDDWDSETDGYIGQTSDGTVTVDSGDMLSCNSGYLGYNSGVTGIATITGSSSGWEINGYWPGLMVGYEGNGILNVSANATVNASGYATVGSESTGAGTVTVDHGAFSAGGMLKIGENGSGTLSLLNGGNVACSSSVQIGANSSGIGTVTVNNGTLALNGWGSLDVGYYGTGTLLVSNAGSVACSSSINVGGNSGAAGTVTVDGTGTTLASEDLHIARSGNGTLNITNQSSVSVTGETTVGLDTGSTGIINFGGNGGTLSTQSLFVAPSQVTGTGTIITNGLVSDVNLTFDSNDDLNQTVTGFGDVAVTLDMTSAYGDLGVGYQGSHSLTIDGVAITSNKGYLGYSAGASGTATVTGSGSWSCDGEMHVGYHGNGKLEVSGGGTVSSGEWSGFYIGRESGSSGEVVVDGSGSLVACTYDLWAGYMGDGVLTVSNGAAVTSRTGGIGDDSAGGGTVTVDGNGSTWSIEQDFKIGGTDWSDGNGILNITNNSSVTVGESTYIAPKSSSTGAINFGASNCGTLSTGSLYASASQVTGAGIIETHGLVCDATLLFNSSQGTSQTMSFGGAATLNLDLTSDYDLGVGYKTNGSLTIDGIAITTNKGYMGYGSGSSGTATISGAGGSWTCNDEFFVGKNGDGILNVTGGASLTTNGSAYVASDEGSSGKVTVGGSSTWNCEGEMIVGGNWSSSATGEVNVNTGGTVTCNSNAYFGYYGEGSGGTLTVTGAGSVFACNGDDFCVGQYTPGTMNVLNGGQVVCGTSYIGHESTWQDEKTSTATVDGAGSTWECNGDLKLGQDDGNAYGVLNITNGGAVTCNETMVIGPNYEDITSIANFSNGTLTTRTLRALPEQVSGNGTINTRGLITDRNYTFNSTGSLVQTFSWGSVSVTLDVSDSESDPGDLGIGLYESHTMTISNGVTVYSNNGYLGYSDEGDYGGSGVATITGAGSTWICQDTLIIGRKGRGTVNVENGGTIETCKVVGCDEGGDSEMTLNFNGGVLKAREDGDDQDDWIGSNGDNGNVYIKAGGVTFDTNGKEMGIGMDLQAYATSTGGVTKTGEGTLKLSGCNTYAGLTTVTEGELKLEDYTNDFTDAFEPVLSGGGADIQGGKIVFYDPEEDPTATIRSLVTASYTGGTAAWTTGTFLCTTKDANHGLGWGSNDTDEVTVMFTLYGDSNLDGSVNGTDLNAVLSYYNQSNEIWGHGDFNYDGSVNGTDLNTVLSNYNQSLSSSTAAVPEPSALLLAAVALLGLLAWRRKILI